jgi:hypothetical protein
MSGFYMSNGWYDFDIVESYSKEGLKSNIDKFASPSINTTKGVGSKYPWVFAKYKCTEIRN